MMTVPTAARKRVKRSLPKVKNNRFEKKIVPFGLSPFTVTTGDIRLYNLLYFVNQGTGNNERIGNLLQKAHVHYRIQASAICQDTFSVEVCETAHVRLIIFAADKEWNSGGVGTMALNTGGSGVIIANSEIFYDTGNDRLATTFLNLQDIQVLHEKVINIDRTEQGTGTTTLVGRGRIMKGTVRLGDLRYNGGNTTYLKGRNIYAAIVAVGSTDNTSLFNIARVRTNFLVTFTDN